MNFNTIIENLNKDLQENFEKGLDIIKVERRTFYPIIDKTHNLKYLNSEDFKNEKHMIKISTGIFFSSEVEMYLCEKYNLKIKINNERSLFHISISNKHFSDITRKVILELNNNVMDEDIFKDIDNRSFSYVETYFKIHNKKVHFGKFSSYKQHILDYETKSHSTETNSHQQPVKTSIPEDFKENINTEFEEIFEEGIKNNIKFMIEQKEIKKQNVLNFQEKLKELNISIEQLDELNELKRLAK